MTVFINNKKVPYFFLDDEDSLLSKYAIMHNSLPSYYRVKKEYELKQDSKIEVEDVRDYLDDKIPTRSFILNLASIFPKLEEKDIIILFLIKKYADETDAFIKHDLDSYVKELKELDNTFSSNSQNIIERMNYYKKAEEENIESLKDKIVIYEKNVKMMNDLHVNINCEDLKIEEITLDIKLELDFGMTLIDIFDSLDVSEKIPFIYVYRGNSLISKVYKNFIIPVEWVEETINADKNKIYFKILNSEKNLTEKNINKIYSDGWWDNNNNIEISMVNNYLLNEVLSGEYIQKNLTDSFDESLNYKIIKSTQSSVRSIFKISNFGFNKVILSDMIDNLEEMSFFIFVNEYQYSSVVKSLTSTTKNRFMVYFNPGNLGDIKNSISLTITPQISDDEQEEWVIVRISKAETQQKAEYVKKIFCLLMKLYIHNYDSVFKIYEKLLPNKIKTIQKYKIRPKKGEKDDKKTGKRLQELKKQRKDTFRSGYSGLCQPMSHQPYLIPPSQVEAIKREYGENKVMEYEDPILHTIDHYACEPREPDEPQTHIYPGLRKNTSKNQKFKTEVPYLPCCFTEDQYKKPASELKKQLLAKKDKPSSDKYKFIELEDISEIGHILGYNKSVPLGRFGQIPYYMNFILKNARYTEIEKGKQMLYPVFRYGIIQSPDSFFHCLEKVTNMRYATIPLDDRIKHVLKVRQEMAKENLDVLRQEFYDYSNLSVKKMLLDENIYIDPGMWIRLAEEHYNCNIFIFQISREHPYGAIVYPRFSNVHLSIKKSKKRPYVLIMKNEIDDKDWPFQCELISKFVPKSKKGKKVEFTFEHSDSFIKEIIKQFNASNIVYTILPTSNKIKYEPISFEYPIFKDVKAQYIDAKGKNRILLYENIFLMISPIPPMNIKSVNIKLEDVIYSSLDVLNSFIEKYNIKIISQRVINKKLVGVFVEISKSITGYIPISSDSILEKIKIFEAPINILNPLEYDEVSKLEVLNRNKKIAMLMMQYTLFEYSHKKSLSEENFIIIEGYEYQGVENISKYLIRYNNVIYKNKKLIATSKEMVDKLLSYLSIELLNDRQGVEKYKERSIVKDYYSKIKDYRHTPSQFLFINFRSLREWIQKQNNSLLEVKKTYQNTDTPFFYKNSNISENKIFIAQNVKGGSLEKALSVCVKWKKFYINPGYDFPESVDPSELIYNIYSPSGLLKKHKSSEKDFYSVLKINGIYVALLPFV